MLQRKRDLPAFGEMFLGNLMSVTAATKAAIFVVIEVQLELLGAKGFGERPSAPSRDQIQGMGGVLQSIGDSLISSGGTFSWPNQQAIGDGRAQELCAPLHLLGRINGVIAVGGKRQERTFAQTDVEFRWFFLRGDVEHDRELHHERDTGHLQLVQLYKLLKCVLLQTPAMLYNVSSLSGISYA